MTPSRDNAGFSDNFARSQMFAVFNRFLIIALVKLKLPVEQNSACCNQYIINLSQSTSTHGQRNSMQYFARISQLQARSCLIEQLRIYYSGPLPPSTIFWDSSEAVFGAVNTHATKIRAMFLCSKTWQFSWTDFEGSLVLRPYFTRQLRSSTRSKNAMSVACA